MYVSSAAFKNAMNSDDNRAYRVSCKIRLKNGVILDITNENLFDDGFHIEESVSGSNSFQIGTAIINELKLNLNNIYQEYDDINFNDAVVYDVRIGLDTESGLQTVRRGKFNVYESKGSDIINLTCYDNMIKFDKAYSTSKLAYPATLLQIVQNACTMCGVPLATDSLRFNNYNFTIDKKPTGENLTYREVLCWVGQIACVWFKCDPDGNLAAGFYDMNRLDTETDVHEIRSIFSIDPFADDVEITGVRVDVVVGEETVSYFQGSQEYAILISENGLVNNTNAERIKNLIAPYLIGLRFRPLTLRSLADPTIEAGDGAVVYDVRDRVYKTFVTSVSFGMYETSISCEAETPAKKNTERFSKASKIYNEVKQALQRNKTETEQALERLKESLEFSSGLYPVVERQEDGSNKFYLCDAPTLEQANVVFELTSSGWGVSTDGGKTWNAGLLVDGTFITQILTTVGINAESINAGVLKIQDPTGNETFYANTETGEVRISADLLKISGKNVEDITKDALSKYIIEKDPVLRIITDSDTYGVLRFGDVMRSTIVPIKVMLGIKDVTEYSYITFASVNNVGEWDQKNKKYTFPSLNNATGKTVFTATYVTPDENLNGYECLSGTIQDVKLEGSLADSIFLMDYVYPEGSYADITLGRNAKKQTCSKTVNYQRGWHTVSPRYTYIKANADEVRKDDSGFLTPDIIEADCMMVTPSDTVTSQMDWKVYSVDSKGAATLVSNKANSNKVSLDLYKLPDGAKALRIDVSFMNETTVVASKTIPLNEDKSMLNAREILKGISDGFQGIYQDTDGNYYIDATYIKAGYIDAGLIKTGYLDADRIQANSINGNRIISGTINGDRLTIGTITGDKLTIGTITGDKIAAKTIDGTSIKAGTITSDNISASKINGDKINAKGIVVKDSKQTTTFSIDENGNVSINANSLAIGNTAVKTSFSSAEILKMLTNNGALKGIYMGTDGQLYISGDYIKTDDLVAFKAKIGNWSITKTAIQSSTYELTADKRRRGISLNSAGSIYVGESTISVASNGVIQQLYIHGGLTIDGGYNADDLFGDDTFSFRLQNIPPTTNGVNLVMDGNNVSRRSSSSKRYKDHIEVMTLGEAEKILDIPVVWFKYKDNYLPRYDKNYGKPIIGFYAEDMDEHFPQACVYDGEGKPEDWDIKNIIPPMLKMIQELKKEVDTLKEEINTLKEVM